MHRTLGEASGTSTPAALGSSGRVQNRICHPGPGVRSGIGPDGFETGPPGFETGPEGTRTLRGFESRESCHLSLNLPSTES